MQKQDIGRASLAAGAILPLAGMGLGAHLAHVPFDSWRAMAPALTYALHHSPLVWAGGVLGAVLGAVAIGALHRFGDDGYRGAPFAKVLRGARLVNAHVLRGRINADNRRKRAIPVVVGDMPMPVEAENRNLLICGSIGTGKSLAIEALVASILRRGDRAVIPDPGGHLLSRFFLPGDTILNPFDARSAGWTAFNEIGSPQDFDRMARSIIPRSPDIESEQWNEHARNVLADTLRKHLEQGTPDMESVVDLLTREDGDVIRAYLQGTDSQGYFRDNAERATASVQFLMTRYVRPLRLMKPGGFAIRTWLEDKSAGNLWITWRTDMKEALKPLISAWVDTLCASVLSQSQNRDRRLWLIIDELASLSKLASFENAATEGRRYGLSIVAGIQDWAQLQEVYGRDAAAVISNCFRNYLFLGAANAANAEVSSKMIGDIDVERVRRTHNVGTRQSGASRTVSHERERLVMASEIATLPDLTGYIKFSGEWPAAKIRLPIPAYPVRVAPFEAC